MDKFDKRNVELLPDEMEMLSATELTQYYIQSWSLEFHNNGTVNRKKYWEKNSFFPHQITHCDMSLAALKACLLLL